MRSLLFIILLSQFSNAQTIVKGIVYDNTSKQPISFASVGIKGKTLGTVSDENGNFEIALKSVEDSDSLKISAIGYHGKCFVVSKAKEFNGEKIYLAQMAVQLNEVTVKPTKTVTKILGNKRYNKSVMCSFSGTGENFLGVEAAIKADNKKGRLVWIEDFNFYINRAEFKDSATFRLNFYKVDKDGMPGENILRKPIVFKAAPRIGVFTIDLKKYNVNTDDDFFISLECLTERLDKSKLNFSGSILGPAYFKEATFANWEKVPVMGLDFNVTVSYQK